jgi:[ribosomal protein S18]-alanine N-acetyltransferase
MTLRHGDTPVVVIVTFRVGAVEERSHFGRAYGASVVHLLRRPFTGTEAAQVAGWHYPPPFDVYDATDAGLFVRRGPDGDGYYPAVDDDGRLVAFAVIGTEARVLGQEPADDVVDVGMGVRPDLTGRGLGGALVGQVVALAAEVTGASAARAAVAAFNERSMALYRSAGFRDVRRFDGPGERTFVELVGPLVTTG